MTLLLLKARLSTKAKEVDNFLLKTSQYHKQINKLKISRFLNIHNP